MSVEGTRGASGEFVDTNVLIYAFDRGAGEKHEVAAELVTRLWMERRGCISIQVMQEFYVSATRKLQMPEEQATVQLRRLRLWRVHRPSVDDILAAIELHQRHSVSFWDGMILRSAQASRCSVLWTEDLANGQRWGEMEVRNPFARPPKG
jgi:predicted nucleic acid-binding protein